MKKSGLRLGLAAASTLRRRLRPTLASASSAARFLSTVSRRYNDIRHLIPALADNRLARVSLPFPDPWPKPRHAKRRFVSPAHLDDMARLLVDGGEFRVASDHPVYQEWTLLHASVHPAFQWLAAGPEDWRTRPADSVATRYEEKARAAGRTPVFMNFTRKPRSA